MRVICEKPALRRMDGTMRPGLGYIFRRSREETRRYSYDRVMGPAEWKLAAVVKRSIQPLLLD